MQGAKRGGTQLAKQRTILNVRKKKRKKLFDALAAEESLAVSKALYEEGLSGMETEYAQYAEAKSHTGRLRHFTADAHRGKSGDL